MLVIRTFGGVALGNTPSSNLVARPKRLAVLIYLAVEEPGHFRRRDTLLRMFWADSDQAHARNALRQTVHVLRRELPPGSIVSRADGALTVNPAMVRCDVVAFDRAYAAGEYAAAFSLVRGAFMEGFVLAGAPEFMAWSERVRSRCRQRMSLCAIRYGDATTRAGGSVDVIDVLSAALEADPTNEELLRRLLIALTDAGQHGHAALSYRSFRSRLMGELAVAPSPETERLASDLLKTAT